MSAFEKLLGELSAAQTEQGELAKSLTATGEAVGAAAAAGDAGAAAAAAGEAGAAGGAEGAAAAGAADGELAKSFKVVLADGTEAEAVDGTAMLKALSERIDGSEQTMAKALSQAVALVQGQSALIKSLSAQVAELAGQGRGRKTVISVVEKPEAGTLAKGGAAGAAAGGAVEGPTIEEFFAKASDAFESRQITGLEFTSIDVAKRTGAAIDPALVKKVMTAPAAAAK